MYANLRQLIKVKGVSVKNFGELLDLSEKAAQNKLFEVTDFTLGEAKKIMIAFPEYSMDYLFQSDGNKRQEQEEVSV